MKYISVAILIGLLSWTWCLATTERPLTLAQHKHVETGVEDDVRALIQRRYPSTTEIYCPQLYTEVAGSGQELIAHFRCLVRGTADASDATDATGDSTEQTFEGMLRLKSDDGFETWWEVGGEIRAKEIRFLNGIKISPRDNTDDTETKKK
jgi:hypothetical protein